MFRGSRRSLLISGKGHRARGNAAARSDLKHASEIAAGQKAAQPEMRVGELLVKHLALRVFDANDRKRVLLLRREADRQPVACEGGAVLVLLQQFGAERPGIDAGRQAALFVTQQRLQLPNRPVF
jgi:hypothetical protein